MHELFQLNIAGDRKTALIALKNDLTSDIEVKLEDLKQFLLERKIVFGIKEDVLRAIVENPEHMNYPLTIAKAQLPQHGTDGYLVTKLIEEEIEDQTNKNKTLNMRDVIKIKSVKKGQLIADIIKPTNGIDGKDIYGNPIKAKDGKPLAIRAGKNVLFHMDKVYATIDGQISISLNAINVLPVFEVQGDIDLKTGNIDFIGNVVIHGNVPTGYSIKAGGDIKVFGLVEGADLTAGGSILISGGIAGASKGNVEAGVNLHANYLNQAKCKVGGDVLIESSILHSEVISGAHVICKKGHIIGGKIYAGKSISVVDIGNHHYIQSELFIGAGRYDIEREEQIKQEIKQQLETLEKIKLLGDRLNKRLAYQGSLTVQEQLFLQKQGITEKMLKNKLQQLEEELVSISEEKVKSNDATLSASGVIYPNTNVHFGKYSKKIHSQFQFVKLFFSQGEIVSVPL